MKKFKYLVASVSTAPGHKALTVTPLPCNFLASWRVKRIFASFEFPYAFQAPGNDFSLLKLSLLMPPYLCKSEETTTMRLGAAAFNKSKSKFVNRKCPKWFTPMLISNPSLVRSMGDKRPALLIRMSRRDSASWNFFENSRIDSSDARSSCMNNNELLPVDSLISFSAANPFSSLLQAR